MSTKEQIIQKLEILSEKNLRRLLYFANGLAKNGDNEQKELKKVSMDEVEVAL
jgi:hypothetical protein